MINTLESALMVFVFQLLLAQRSIAGIVAKFKVQSGRDLMFKVEVVNASKADGGGAEEAGLFVVDGTGEGVAVVLGVSVLLIESVGSNWLIDVEIELVAKIAAKERHGLSHFVRYRGGGEEGNKEREGRKERA
jgi:hypothetical protein